MSTRRVFLSTRLATAAKGQRGAECKARLVSRSQSHVCLPYGYCRTCGRRRSGVSSSSVVQKAASATVFHSAAREAAAAAARTDAQHASPANSKRPSITHSCCQGASGPESAGSTVQQVRCSYERRFARQQGSPCVHSCLEDSAGVLHSALGIGHPCTHN